MDNTALYEQIISKLRLKSDITQILVCLEEYVANFFTPKEQTNLVALFEQLPNGLPQVLKDALLNEPITVQNQNLYKTRIEEIENKLRLCKTIQLTLAFKPDESTIDVISEWIKKNVGPDAVIDLQFDKSIVGGAQLIVDGIYKDYSVRKNLAGRFQIQRDEIMEMLK